MGKYGIKIFTTPKNTFKVIFLINFYYFAIIYTTKLKYIGFFAVQLFFSNNINLCNANQVFKFMLQKSTIYLH